MLKKLYIQNLNLSIERISYRDDITGLRGIAVIAVVLFHSNVIYFEGGWLGVDVFFVISGYLISNIILSELDNNNFQFKNFYYRRIRRILPALFSTIFLSIFIGYILLTPKAIIEFANSAVASIFFFANFYFENLDFYNAESTKYMPLLHTWSLSIEEQFYIFFPLFCYLIYKINKKFIIFSFTTLFVFSLYLNSTVSTLSKFYQPQYRVWELIFGSLVMIISQKISIKHIEKFGLLILFFAFFYFDDSMLTLNSIEPKIAAVFATGLLLINKNNNLVQSFLQTRFLIFFGNISYSLYLLHQPLLAYLKIYLNRNDQVFDKEIYFYLIFLVFLSFLSWKYIERYFLKTKLSNVFIFLLITMFFIVFFSFLVNKTDGFKFRYNHVPEEVLYYSLNVNFYTSSDDYDKFREYCVNESSKENLIIIGDSQINTFVYTLFKEYKELSCDYNILAISNPSGRCLLSQQTDTMGEVEVCSDSYFNNFLEAVKKDNNIVLAIGRFEDWLDPEKGSAEVYCDNCEYTSVFSNRLKLISEASQFLAIVDPTPTYPVKVAESYIYKKYTWGEDITISYTDWFNSMGDTYKFLEDITSQKIIRISPNKSFCNIELDKCYATKNKEIYYTDKNHLTIEGNRILIEHVFSRLESYLNE